LVEETRTSARGDELKLQVIEDCIRFQVLLFGKAPERITLRDEQFADLVREFEYSRRRFKHSDFKLPELQLPLTLNHAWGKTVIEHEQEKKVDPISQFNLALGLVLGSLENVHVTDWLRANGTLESEIEDAQKALHALVRAAYVSAKKPNEY
jgi:hypothetical protein